MPDNDLPPVLLLHGTNAGAWTMDNVRQSFAAAGYACHGLTYRYHELPPGPVRDSKLVGVSIADYVEDARQEIARIGKNPIVVGHSLGGVVGQLLAADGLVTAGILLNSSIVHGILPTTDGERELGKLFISAGAIWEQALGQDLDLLAKYGLNTLNADRQREIHRRLGTESGRVLFEFVFWMYDTQQTTLIEHEKVSCPLLFVTGTEDKAVATSTARRMAERYKTADLHVVEGACHYIQFEDEWAGIASNIIRWLDQKL